MFGKFVSNTHAVKKKHLFISLGELQQTIEINASFVDVSSIALIYIHISMASIM